MWWLNSDQGWKEISQKVYYAAGYGGNYIIVDKEHDLVELPVGLMTIK